MQLIWDGIVEAIRLILRVDSQVATAAMTSLWISSMAVALAGAFGLPIGLALARRAIPGRRLVIVLFRAGMAFPTVFVGLICYALFSRRGPLGPWNWLHTPWAIICGEFLLAVPIVASICHGAFSSLDVRVGETAITLGASRWRRIRTYISEARTGVVLAFLTAFSRCVTELGIAMMVGGNIKDRTRTLATSTALETSRGDFGRALALGLILLVMSLGVTFLIVSLGREDSKEKARR